MKTLILSLIFTVSCLSQTLNIEIDESHFGIDHNNSIVLSHIDMIDDYTNTSEYQEIIISFNQQQYSFNTIPTRIEYSNSYTITSIITSDQYTLYFTELPIIAINTTQTIVDEPKVLAQLIYADDEQIVNSNIGIEIRGGVSKSYAKKTYDIEFWEDEVGDESADVQFGTLRSDDDWVLDALYNEPLRLRSYTASKLWLEMHSPHYQNEEDKAKSGADLMYVEIFLNNQYNGLYTLSEQVDRKQLKLKSFNDEIRGELYKGISWAGGTHFYDLKNINNDQITWNGYEYKYPKEEDIIDWGQLYDFVNFVVNSSDINFSNEIWNRFNFDNYGDYYLFLNLIRARDNQGKNIYLAKYNTKSAYFYAPWDLDGVFGTDWKGLNDVDTDDILTNGFMKRVNTLNPDNSSAKIANKWFDYRKGIFSKEQLSNSFTETYQYLNTHKIYEREAIVYPNYSFDSQNLLFSLNWIENRLTYLDSHFKDFEDKSLSSSDVNSFDKNSFFYPNPVINKAHLNSNLLLNKQYKIYNSIGQLVLKGIILNQYISLKNLPSGLYFIKIDQNVFKLIKK